MRDTRCRAGWIRRDKERRHPDEKIQLANWTLSGALILTNPAHGLIWKRQWLDEFVHVERSPIAWGILIYLACLYLVVCIRLVRFAACWPVFRWPAVILLAGTLSTLLVDVLVAGRLLPRTPLDPTILAVDFNLTLYVLGIIGFRQLLDILPVAREIAIQRMQDGIAVLNAQGRIAFQNPAAETLLGNPWSIAGDGDKDSSSELVDLARQAAAQPVDIHVALGEERKQYIVQATPLEDPRGWPLGNLLIFQDITDRIRARQLLVRQQRMLAVLEERERIAGELHDDLGQVLGYVKLQAQAARDRISMQDYGNADLAMTQLLSITQDAHLDVREFILGARAAADLERGFLPTLENYLEQVRENFGLPVELDLSPDWDKACLEPTMEVQLLRIIQEALSNTRKHAQPKSVVVSLATLNDHAQIAVQDDGQGFDPDQLAEGQGLSFGIGFMRRRAEGIGGALEVQSAPGRGTRVIVRVPLGKSMA